MSKEICPLRYVSSCIEDGLAWPGLAQWCLWAAWAVAVANTEPDPLPHGWLLWREQRGGLPTTEPLKTPNGTPVGSSVMRRPPEW